MSYPGIVLSKLKPPPGNLLRAQQISDGAEIVSSIGDGVAVNQANNNDPLNDFTSVYDASVADQEKFELAAMTGYLQTSNTSFTKPPWTMSIIFSAPPGSGPHGLCASEHYSGTYGTHWGPQLSMNPDGTIVMFAKHKYSGQSWGYNFTTPSSYDDGELYFLTNTVSPGGLAKLYINGVLIGQSQCPYGDRLVTTNARFRVGWSRLNDYAEASGLLVGGFAVYPLELSAEQVTNQTNIARLT